MVLGGEMGCDEMMRRDPELLGTAAGLDEDRVLALAASVEAHVNHPLADAIVDAAVEVAAVEAAARKPPSSAACSSPTSPSR